jgi:8-hydroxy-5-deazaflavin:NADPH oxidoreductase
VRATSGSVARVRIAVIGGTGDEGFGLALRLARAGHHVVIGSRAEERGAEAAERARHILAEDTPVDGTSNERAAAGAELVFVTVPYAGQADIYRSIKDHVPEGRVLVDTTTPLATAVGGRAWQVIRPWHGSAAEQAKALLAPGVRLVAGFHTVAAEPLQDLERPVEGDVLLCGDDPEAKLEVGAVVEQIPELRWVDVGALAMARVVEPLTALLVSVNRNYKLRETGIKLVGREAWGRPAR